MDYDHSSQQRLSIAGGTTVQDGSIFRSLMASNSELSKAVTEHDAALQVLADLGISDNAFRTAIALNTYNQFEDESPAEVRRLVQRIRNINEDASAFPPSLRGVDGLQTLSFLKAYLGRFVNDDGRFERRDGKIVPVRDGYRLKVSGKITDYLFVAGPASASSPPDPRPGSGHLSVNVTCEEFDTDDDFIACQPTRSEFYHWDIELCACEVHHRVNHFTDDPFPTLPKLENGQPKIKFPPHALDPDDPRSIWCRCLDHKLYAEGRDIKVHHVYRRENGGDLQRLPETHSFYESTDTSCVDIMFEGFPPATNLPPQIEYCLGRCAHPPIVNTGGG